MTNCCVPFCDSVSKRGCGIKFHSFPKNPILKNQWYRLIRRRRPLTKYSSICSLHFVDDDYMSVRSPVHERRLLKSKAVPSRNLPTNRIVFDCEIRALEEKYKERLDRINKREMSKSTTPHLVQQVVTEPVIVKEEPKDDEIESSTFEFCDIQSLTKDRSTQVNFITSAQTTTTKPEESSTTHHQTKQFKVSVLLELLAEDDLKYYTGFSYIQFNMLWHALRNEPMDDRFDRYLSKKDQLIMCIMGYKLSVSFMLIGHLYGLDRSIVSDIFKYWTSILYNHFKSINFWQMRYEHADSYTAVVDYIEFEKLKATTNHPTTATTSKQRYERTTFKILLAIDVKGFVIFCSDIFDGSRSDSQMIHLSGLLDLLQSGDMVLADRDFDISEILAGKGVQVNVPPVNGIERHLTKKEIKDTKLVANCKSHVEYVMNKIQDPNFPTSYSRLTVNQCAYVAAFLTNFTGGIA